MQAHATMTQSPLKRFVNATPHATIERQFWLGNAVVLTIDTRHVPLSKIAAVNSVEQIHANYNLSVADTTPAAAQTGPATAIAPTTAQLQPMTTPETTDGLARLQVPTAWEYTRGEGTSIAIIDTGVDPDHPDIDIEPTNWNDWNKDGSERDTTPQDYGSHGTHVSGTAVGGNASGVAIGVAPEAELYHGAALNQNCDVRCDGTIAQILAGMQWAVEQDVAVISMSLGGVDTDKNGNYVDNYIDQTASEVRDAHAAGTVVVAAAGNSGTGNTTSPGNVYDAISVGATDTNGAVADFSSSGTVSASDWDNPPADWPDTYAVPTVVAPGVSINSSVPGGAYKRFRGTSMATPHVSGTVALMLAASDEQLSPAEIKTTLETTATDTGDKRTQGAGEINTAAAVEAVTAESKANITATISAVPDKVTAGQQFSIEYAVTNTGSTAGNDTLTFRTNGTVVRSIDTETINPGETKKDLFSYRPTRGESGQLLISVDNGENIDSRIITIVEPQVKLTNISITPTEVTKTITTHELNVTIQNISDDGETDTVTTTLPEKVTIVDNKMVTATDLTGAPVTVTNTAVSNGNRLIFEISPDTESELRDVIISARIDLRRSK